MESIQGRLRAAVRFDAVNGTAIDRAICGRQMSEAADVIEVLIAGKRQMSMEAARLRRIAERRREDKRRLEGKNWVLLGCIADLHEYIRKKRTQHDNVADRQWERIKALEGEKERLIEALREVLRAGDSLEEALCHLLRPRSAQAEQLLEEMEKGGGK